MVEEASNFNTAGMYYNIFLQCGYRNEFKIPYGCGLDLDLKILCFSVHTNSLTGLNRI